MEYSIKLKHLQKVTQICVWVNLLSDIPPVDFVKIT